MPTPAAKGSLIGETPRVGEIQDSLIRECISPEGKVGFLKRMKQQQNVQLYQNKTYFATGDSFHPSTSSYPALTSHRQSQQHAAPTTESSAQYYTNGLGALALNLHPKAPIY